MNKLDQFNFILPEQYIAQKPLEQRDRSKLLVLKGNKIQHKLFYELVHEINEEDILILNDSKVSAAKFNGIKETGGKVTLLFLKEIEPFKWQCLIKGKRIRPNIKIIVENGLFEVEIIKKIREGIFLTHIFSKESMFDLIKNFGKIPIPNYIKKIDKKFDYNKYQTVFAKNEGSIASPTAGLHFTNKLLADLSKKGVKIKFITLHVGVGLILKIHVDDPKDYPMESEFFQITEETANLINYTRETGNRVIAVGTTTLKALESASTNKGKIFSTKGYSDLFIYPGYKFKFRPDCFITNFHLPKSPPLLMAAAYTGTRRLLNAYQVAIKNNYRFYSFGDVMFIIS